MNPLEILFLAFALGLDAFSVAVAVGMRSARPRQLFRLSWHFGLFQFLMPLLGWGFGKAAGALVGTASQWIAFTILIVIGTKMLAGEIRGPRPDMRPVDRTRGWSLVSLSIATSIDAFAAGISLGMLSVSVIPVSLIIGVTAALMTLAGMLLGRTVSASLPWLTARTETLGALILYAIALKAIW